MKRRCFFRNLLIILIPIILLMPLSLNAADQPANDQAVKFFVHPMKLEMPVKPGESLSREITIENQFPTPLTIRTYAMDYEIKADNTFEFFPPGYESYSCANWITLSDSQFTLEGNQQKTVTLSLAVPAKVEPKGHYAVVFFESVGKPLAENTTGVITQGRIGTLVLQYVPGQGKLSGFIESFNIPKYFWSTPKFIFFGGTQMVPWQMVFKNAGNIHLNLENTVQILDIRGKSVYTSTPQRITVLPGTSRELKGTWDNAPTFGVFKAINKATFTDAEGNNRTDSKTLTFYIIPGRAIAITLGIIILVILIILLAYKLGKKRAKKNQIPCQNCKKLVDKNTTYCPNCGKKVTK